MAGSSMPIAWRMPSVDMPFGADVEEVMSVGYGGVDSYDFHAVEVLQCMAERRKGDETGVQWVEALEEDAVWEAMRLGSWAEGGWSLKLFESCLTLKPPHCFRHICSALSIYTRARGNSCRGTLPG